MSERVGGSERIPELDGLRGLAIGLVILCHYVANADHRQLGIWPHRILTGFTFGWSGVDLFFVLSGFLIGGILLEAREAPHYFRAFYMRRVHRILPVYYVWVLLFAGLVMWGLWVAPGSLGATKADLREVPIHLLFLQNLQTGLPGLTWMWLAVAWSLAVEEQFYLVMPLMIRWLNSRTTMWVLVMVICGAPLFRLLVFECDFTGYDGYHVLDAVPRGRAGDGGVDRARLAHAGISNMGIGAQPVAARSLAVSGTGSGSADVVAGAS